MYHTHTTYHFIFYNKQSLSRQILKLVRYTIYQIYWNIASVSSDRRLALNICVCSLKWVQVPIPRSIVPNNYILPLSICVAQCISITIGIYRSLAHHTMCRSRIIYKQRTCRLFHIACSLYDLIAQQKCNLVHAGDTLQPRFVVCGAHIDARQIGCRTLDAMRHGSGQLIASVGSLQN